MAINKLPTPSANYKVVANDTTMRNKINEVVDEVDRQETIITDHNSKIMQLLNWMGLVKDYVIETGSNDNGSWTKWNSGRLEFVQRYVFETTSTGLNNHDITPIQNFVSGEAFVQLRSMTGGYNNITLQRTLTQGGSDSKINIGFTNDKVSSNVVVSVMFDGFYK
jgi:hypothetical protein